MEKLDLAHHKIIVTLIILFVFILSIFFGVTISGATRGTEGMSVIIFAMMFMSIILSFIIFTQVIHLRHEMTKLEQEELAILRKRR